eukprot:s509_g18.t1
MTGNWRPSEPVRVDVSQPKGYSFQVSARFAEEKKPKALNSRIAHLRRIHAHLIEDERPKSDEENEDEGEAEEAHAQSATPAQSLCQRLSCRATKSSNDAAEPTVRLPKMTTAQLFLEWRISVSKVKLTASSSADKWFRTTQMSWWVSATGIGLNLVPLVLRDFQNVSYPVNVGVLERALVMPAHKLNPGHLNGIYIVNTSPDLLSNPFLAKKKKIKKKKKLGKGKKSRSTSAKKGKGK